MTNRKPIRILISAGGTGGHIFPAIAVAQTLKRMDPAVQILFVGAKGRMEMEKVPQSGFAIEGINIHGFNRKLTLKNLMLPFTVLRAMIQVKSILKKFKPHVVVGFGGYSTGPVLKKAQQKGIPTIIQEQNSFPGLTNRILAKKAVKICVAYPEMGKHFEQQKIVETGNPVRPEIINSKCTPQEARKHFGLNPDKVTILAIGGSLGALTINKSICQLLPALKEKDTQLIWQIGKNYVADMCANAKDLFTDNNVVKDFIREMDLAYAAADIVISRAGAIAISEICVLGKPVILVPSPNVTDDHQTKNALSLSEKEAAILIRDNESIGKLPEAVIKLIEDAECRKKLASNILKFARPDAAEKIAETILENRRMNGYSQN